MCGIVVQVGALPATSPTTGAGAGYPAPWQVAGGGRAAGGGGVTGMVALRPVRRDFLGMCRETRLVAHLDFAKANPSSLMTDL